MNLTTHEKEKAEYAIDVLLYDEPWIRWQWSYRRLITWFDCAGPLSWYPLHQYRRNPIYEQPPEQPTIE